jgi:hypothetical protein
MEVSSVSSSSYTPPPQAQTQRAERPESTPQKASNDEQPERTEERKPAPVVNTQGQTTGRIVNTSA